MVKILIIGLGGFIGTVLRYLSNIVVHKFLSPGFPWGTLIVNLIGCFGIGYMMHYFESRSLVGSHWQVFLIIGVLGGFTTFSAFGYETITLLKNSAYLSAFCNVVGHMSVCLLAVFLGYNLKP